MSIMTLRVCIGVRSIWKTFLGCGLLILSCAAPAGARIIRIAIDQKQSPAYGGKSFGAAGQYEILAGRAFGELSPKSQHNTIITDLELAPRNPQGRVEYVATFTIVKPIDVAKSNGVLFYGVPNRGNRNLGGVYGIRDETGTEFLLKRGNIILNSGWQADVSPRSGIESIIVPVARNAGGSSITGRVSTRFLNTPAGANTVALPPAHASVDRDTARAVLTKSASDGSVAIAIDSREWSFGDCAGTAFPGTPSETKVCLIAGFDSNSLYELTYVAKDPLVLGIGYAATRDIVSFFRYQAEDSSHSPNPLAGRISRVIAQGVSQSGNFVKSFIHLGFNQDEENRIVWDGANAHIAGRQLALNIRFATPGNTRETGSEAILWWGDYTDTTRGKQQRSSMLDRCRATKTCPKIFDTFGASEFWSLRMSPNLVGTAADRDIPLPSEVRRYYFPGTKHGGGDGGFDPGAPPPPPSCELPDNPNSEADTMRALFVAFNDWATKDKEPPASVYPRLDQGRLVSPDSRKMGFPVIPGTPLPDHLIVQFYDNDYGPEFHASDLSGVQSIQPPVVKRVFPLLVPKTDSDGNEIGGIPSPLHQAPLGSYLGWNVTTTGALKGRACQNAGAFLPFAQTKAERLASGDPRPSLEERYRDHAAYVEAVRGAIDRLVQQRFLLPEDAARLSRQAEESKVMR
jgi:hypothetical protein